MFKQLGLCKQVIGAANGAFQLFRRFGTMFGNVLAKIFAFHHFATVIGTFYLNVWAVR
jgi:hypothetical protein